jgi:hypothetical protein
MLIQQDISFLFYYMLEEAFISKKQLWALTPRYSLFIYLFIY